MVSSTREHPPREELRGGFAGWLNHVELDLALVTIGGRTILCRCRGLMASRCCRWVCSRSSWAQSRRRPALLSATSRSMRTDLDRAAPKVGLLPRRDPPADYEPPPRHGHAPRATPRVALHGGGTVPSRTPLITRSWVVRGLHTQQHTPASHGATALGLTSETCPKEECPHMPRCARSCR